MDETRLISFEPVVNDTTKVLILGSMPGGESLRKHQYYGHPRNQFWKIMFALFDLPYTDDYDKKLKLVLDNGIGLWDVIESCNREGSLDADIKNEKVNDFEWIFNKYTNITHVVFDGSKAYETFRKKVGFDRWENISFKRLTSTSPANTISYEKKLEEWKVILKYLRNNE